MRMLGAVFAVAMVTSAFGGNVDLPAGWQVRVVPIDRSLAQLSDQQLIDRLSEETGGDFQPATQVDEFLPLDVAARASSTGRPEGKSPVMTEIVRRGAQIIPALLDHLSDSRPTHLNLDPQKLHLNGHSGPYTDTYDFRFHDNGPQPSGVNSDIKRAAQGNWPYNVKVGDLCFVALGQIVNRRLYVAGPDFGNGMMYSGIFGLEINSPVESPSLAAAARADWGQITAGSFAEALEHDALWVDPNARPKHVPPAGWQSTIDRDGALIRLLFYYPDMGCRVAETLLRRPLTHWALEATKVPSTEPRATDRDQEHLVMSLDPFRWQSLDNDIWHLYQTAADEEDKVVAARPPGGRLPGDDLPLVCAERLIHKGHDDEFVAFFSRQLTRMNREYPVVMAEVTDSVMKAPSVHNTPPNSPLADADQRMQQSRITMMRELLLNAIKVRIAFLRELGVSNVTGPEAATMDSDDTMAQPPKLIEGPNPEYSEALRNAGINGQVIVQFSVDATGAVQDVTVFKSDHPELEGPSMDAVKKWKFKPAMKNGQAVATPKMRVPITFNIPPTPFRAVKSFEEALKLADQEHKIVFVDFFTTWCGPCKMLDKDTWQDPSVILLLKDKSIALKIDAEKNEALATRYNVNAYPTLALIRPDGTLIDSLVGYRDAPTFKNEFSDALAGKTKFVQAREAVEKAGADLEKQAKSRFDLGRELARKGENAEALAEYLWCFDVGMKQAPSYAGVRVSFLLSDIASLGAHYPPALDALRARRDGDRAKLSDDRNAAVEFGGINHYLGEDNVTLDAFEKLPPDSSVREALGHWVFDTLLEAKRYADAAAASPAAKFRAQFDMMRATKTPNDSMRGYLVDSAAKELEALAGAGKLDDARDLLKTLLEYDHSDATTSAVQDHLKRAGHVDLMQNPLLSPMSAPVPRAGG